MPEIDKEKTPASQVRDLYERHITIFGPYRDAMNKEESFLEGDRYVDRSDPDNLDRRMIQVVGQETQDTVRHIVAKATEKPRSIEARPVDMDFDADQGEIASSLVEHELSNPWKMFDDECEAALIDCCEKRLGVVWMDWDPDCGPFGEILYRRVDPRRIMWDEAYHPHHPKCPFILEEKRLPVETIHALWPKSKDWVTPDREAFTASGELRTGVPLIRSGDGKPLGLNSPDDGKATLWFCWYKNDPSEKPGNEVPGTDAALEPGQRYLSCTEQCGYRSQTEADYMQAADSAPASPLDGALAAEVLNFGQLPEEYPSCPQCGGMLERIDSKSEGEVLLAYSRGKRLVITAPLAAAPDDETVFDGDWPIPSARSFPALFLIRYVKGGKPMGPSDVTLMRDQQIASDQLATLAVQRVFEHRNYWYLPSAGVTDFRGQRFVGRDDQFNFIYRDLSKAQEWGDMSIQLLNGTGLDPSWPLAYQTVQAKLTQYRGMNDQGPIEERAKAKSGVALQTENAIGEVPVAHFVRRKAREVSRFAGVLWDYIRATYKPERLRRLNLDGIDLAVALKGDDLPGYDFAIEDTPDFTGLDEAKSKAFDGLMGALGQAMQLGLDATKLIEVYAKVNNLPRSIVRDFQKMVQPAQPQEQSMPGDMADPNAAPDEMDQLAGLTGMDEQMPDGLNAPGMVPGAVA